jgi:molybdate transport system substrate-binding protein
MKKFLCGIVLIVLSFAAVHAQNATPAVPVDPNQPRPAQPVAPDELTPPGMNPSTPPQPPAPSSPPSTNSAPAPAAATVALTIVADSSLKAVLQELAQTWANSLDSSPQVPLTLTNAGTLRTQVESGTVWDVVIDADVKDMKEMTDRGLLSADGQCSLARNTLVVYGRKALIKDDDLEWFDLIGTEWRKVALGNPDLVESGRVATRALQKHDLADDDHKDLYVYAPTEAKALGVAEREEADAVFVYKTDLASISLPGFEALYPSSADAPPVFYTAAVSSQAKNPAQAQAFILFCGGETGRAIWAKYGFETN